MATTPPTTRPTSKLVAAGRAVDLVFRVLYCGLAPFILVVLRAMLPIEGLVIGISFATVIALVGSASWHARVDRIRYIGRALGGFARIGAFYDEHPPKPLIYYVAFPLLLPVVLFRRVPRRELGMMRRFNVVAVTAIVGTSAWEFWRHWWPQLGVKHFLTATLVVMLFQMIATMMFISPIVTTLVIARQRGHRKLLGVVVALMVTSTVLGVVAGHARREFPFMVQSRVKERSKLDDAQSVRVDALRAAAAANNDVEVARGALQTLYLPDEAAAFDLAADSGTLVLYVRFGNRTMVWTALAGGKVVTEPDELPAALRARLGV